MSMHAGTFFRNRGQGTITCCYSALVLLIFSGCEPRTRQVILYASQDQVYAEPLLEEFTRETGIRVKSVFDSEATKTVGLANRLLAEAAHPQCDVFWNNEELRTRQLARQNLFPEINGWTAFGSRRREIVVNTNKLAVAEFPRGLQELTNSQWRGKVALAYPLFGTTATHFMVLRQRWGNERWQKWCQALVDNQPILVDGNSVVVRLVGRGEAWVGLTDSDDIAAALRDKAPVAGIDPQDASYAIPNTVAILRAAPHAEAATVLLNFLRRPETAQRLVASGALRTPETPSAESIKWDELLDEAPETTSLLKKIFLR